MFTSIKSSPFQVYSDAFHLNFFPTLMCHPSPVVFEGVGHTVRRVKNRRSDRNGTVRHSISRVLAWRRCRKGPEHARLRL